jgi:hypothetical protein
MITIIRNTKSKCTPRPNININSRDYYLISSKRNNINKRFENLTRVHFGNDLTKTTNELSLVQITPFAINNYSTTAEHTVSTAISTVSPEISYHSPESLSINNPLVILPQPRYTPRETGKILSGVFTEHLAVLRACLKIGEVERANHILTNLYKQCTSDTKKYLDIKLHNEFIESYLEAKPPRINEALQWFDKLNYYELTPDLATFAILIRGHLRCEIF